MATSEQSLGYFAYSVMHSEAERLLAPRDVVSNARTFPRFIKVFCGLLPEEWTREASPVRRHAVC
jgi:hypothetical protein